MSCRLELSTLKWEDNLEKKCYLPQCIRKKNSLFYLQWANNKICISPWSHFEISKWSIFIPLLLYTMFFQEMVNNFLPCVALSNLWPLIITLCPYSNIHSYKLVKSVTHFLPPVSFAFNMSDFLDPKNFICLSLIVRISVF